MGIKIKIGNELLYKLNWKEDVNKEKMNLEKEM